MNWLWSSGYEGKLLVNFNEGSFALWRLFPRFRVSVDGRFEEVYEENVVEQTHCALSSKCSRQKNAIEFINPDVILSEKSQFALNASLAYKRVYADERHEVFVRVGLEPVNGPGEITDLWDAHFKAEDLVNGKELINHGDTGNKAATS